MSLNICITLCTIFVKLQRHFARSRVCLLCFLLSEQRKMSPRSKPQTDDIS